MLTLLANVISLSWLKKRQGTVNYLRAQQILAGKNFTPALVSLPKGKRILVLAPHPDDEVIGCGGTLRKHILAGGHITVAFMTDGAKGRPAAEKLRQLSGENGEESAVSVSELRKQEARRAAAIVGIQDLIFLGYPDAGLSASPGVVSKLASLLSQTRPDLVYLPFFTDTHHDHHMTNEVLIRAMGSSEVAKQPFLCCGYEIWNPIFPNCVVEIRSEMGVKIRALKQYQSQLDNNFVRSISHLNAYRSITGLGSRGYAEAFFLASKAEYAKVFRELWGERDL